MKRGLSVLFIAHSLCSNLAFAKDQKQWFNQGAAEYFASRCNTALEPLYQASILDGPLTSQAHLYLAHCQSVLGQNDNAAFHLEQVEAKALPTKADKKLFHELKQKHKAEIDKLTAIGFSFSPYYGFTTVSPDSTKSGSSYYGGALSAYRPKWSVGLGYEGLAIDMNVKNVANYSQSMIFAQGGYFVLDSLKLSASATSVEGSTDQMKGIKVLGVQADYYVTPIVDLFVEGYSSQYPKLLADSKYSYQYPVSATQFVIGSSFPIYNALTYGFNGAASVTAISLNKSSDKSAVVDKSLEHDTTRYEVVLSSWCSAATASITYWAGTEVLGVRGRGAVINNSTEQKTGGVKLSAGYGISKYVGVGASVSQETYKATDLTSGTYKEFTATGGMGTLSLNW